jgi:hypothetical protein
MKTSAAPQVVALADELPEKLTASERRALEPLLLSSWSLQALWPRLPLLFPTDPDAPPSPKTRYRSQYHYPGAAPLQDAAKLAVMRPFEVSLYLIDFSPLEPLLAQHYQHSHKGQLPFHPVSMFLALMLRRELHLNWRPLADLLAGDHGAGWRALCGFQTPHTPSASGLRYFFVQVGPDFFAELCQRFMDLLFREGLCSEHSTYPGDSPEQGVTITEDGMLHPARHRSTCQLATTDCYQPIPPQAPAPPQRPCRARDNGHDGCACNTPDCQNRCRRASALDPEARFIHYDGHNKGRQREANSDRPAKGGGTDVFGYRSIAERVLDDQLHVAWTMRSNLYPANMDERTCFTQGLTRLCQRFPDLHIGEWIDDAAVGYGECLDAIWQARARRMVDIRADAGDADPQTCLSRGYDAQGHPLCPHGYRLHSNGYDYKRRRRKYLCRQVCRHEPRRQGETVQCVADCPYLAEDHALGYVLNVGRTLPDGSLRLAREIPYGSPEWHARYGRRNNAESRNGQVEGLGLKRMRSFALERNTKEVQMADLIINLRTMGRLLKQASRLPTLNPDG